MPKHGGNRLNPVARTCITRIGCGVRKTSQRPCFESANADFTMSGESDIIFDWSTDDGTVVRERAPVDESLLLVRLSLALLSLLGSRCRCVRAQLADRQVVAVAYNIALCTHVTALIVRSLRRRVALFV
jgi:hypothetical protein